MAHRNNGWIYRNRIDRDADDWCVLDFYTKRYPHATRAEWEARIRQGIVLLNGRPTEPDARLARGQQLAYHRPPWIEPDVPQTIPILYEDAHILAVNKPSGLPVMPGGNFLDHTLLALLRASFGPIAPIHRLGRGTSGVVLCARTRLARSCLSNDLRQNRMHKLYRALATGTDLPDTLSITHPIGPIPYPQLGTLYAATPDGKPAHTLCRVLHRNPDQNNALLHIHLITGRPHQIRIHLAAVGHPLAGDPLYISGGRPRTVAPHERIPLPGDLGYHLHAHRLTAHHPETNREFTVTAPLPDMLKTPEERDS